MVIQQEKEKKKKYVYGDVLSYMDYLEREKYNSGKKGTASLYRTQINFLKRIFFRCNQLFRYCRIICCTKNTRIVTN